MDFSVTDEQQLLRDTAREFLAAEGRTWAEAEQLGWASLGEPDGFGGILEMAIVAQEIGRAHWESPFVEAMARGRGEVGALLSAAELLGTAEAGLALALGHVKERQQFGRPIGTFQAARHRLADMSTEIELCRVLVYKAAWLLDRGEDAHLLVSQAKLAACRASYAALMGSHQLHGGVGFTSGHALPPYTLAARRATAAFGNAEEHITRIQELLQLA